MNSRERILTLLGEGVQNSQVAAAVGVSESYISQLLAEEDFAAQVVALRYENLRKHSARDSAIDELEDDVLKKLKETLPLVMRPLELTKVFQVLNAAKRRGQNAPDAALQHQKIVNITVPIQIVQKFAQNPQGQALLAGSQELITMQSGTLLQLHKRKEEESHVDESPARSIASG